MKKFICAVFIASMLCLSGCTSAATVESSEKTQVKEGRFISDWPNCYVVTDSETGVQYLYCKGVYDGGVTVMLNADGTPCIADGYEK